MKADMTEEQFALEELAECIKELCRIMATVHNASPIIKRRLEKVYAKATEAKNRVNR